LRTPLDTALVLREILGGPAGAGAVSAGNTVH
jgi:hypothetical protein